MEMDERGGATCGERGLMFRICALGCLVSRSIAPVQYLGGPEGDDRMVRCQMFAG